MLDLALDRLRSEVPGTCGLEFQKEIPKSFEERSLAVDRWGYYNQSLVWSGVSG